MLLRTVIDAYLHEAVNYGTFYLAVIITALHCGARWGATCVVTSAAAAALVLPPLGKPVIGDLSDFAGFILFMVVAGLIVWLCHSVRQHHRVAQMAAHDRHELLLLERAAREEAERLNQVKDRFLAAVSHELRTPLQSILGWAQLLRDCQLSDEEVTLATDAIERGVLIQSQLINDLLDLSRIVMGKVRIDVRPIALSETVHAAVQTVLPAAKAKNVRIDVQCRGMGAVLGDPDRLQQVAWNLLSNAIKFTTAGGSVQVSLTQQADFVSMAVADTGQGIPAEFLPHVFERFQQAEGERRKEGLGLGLAIVKELVELHGGTVRAASNGLGHGAEFTVLLPRHRPSAIGVEPEAAPSTVSRALDAALAGKQVLVIDDDADARDVLRKVLCNYGAEVLTADSAEQANVLMQSYAPDVVTCDLDMPGATGFDFLEQLHHRDLASSVRPPVVALTACGGESDRRRVSHSGFQGHLIKPVEPRQLAAALAEVTGPARRPR